MTRNPRSTDGFLTPVPLKTRRRQDKCPNHHRHPEQSYPRRLLDLGSQPTPFKATARDGSNRTEGMDITLCQHLTDSIQQRSESRDDQNRCHEAQPMIPQVQNHCIDHRSQHDDSLCHGRSPLTGNMTILPRRRNHGRNQQGQEKQGPDHKRPASRHVSGRHRPGQPRSLITSFHAYSPFASSCDSCGKKPASLEPQQSQKDAKSQQARLGHRSSERLRSSGFSGPRRPDISSAWSLVAFVLAAYLMQWDDDGVCGRHKVRYKGVGLVR